MHLVNQQVLNTNPFLASLCQDDNDASLPLPSSTPHSLHQADGILLSIEAYNEVHLSDIQPLFPNTRRYKRVEASLTEPVHHLQHIWIAETKQEIVKVLKSFHLCV